MVQVNALIRVIGGPALLPFTGDAPDDISQLISQVAIVSIKINRLQRTISVVRSALLLRFGQFVLHAFGLCPDHDRPVDAERSEFVH